MLLYSFILDLSRGVLNFFVFRVEICFSALRVLKKHKTNGGVYKLFIKNTINILKCVVNLYRSWHSMCVSAKTKKKKTGEKR